METDALRKNFHEVTERVTGTRNFQDACFKCKFLLMLITFCPNDFCTNQFGKNDTTIKFLLSNNYLEG